MGKNNDDLRECDERSESMTNMESKYGDTFNGTFYRIALTVRPCEHKVVTLGKRRQKYGAYTRLEQVEILKNIDTYARKAGYEFMSQTYEFTDLQEMRLAHLHCIVSVHKQNIDEWVEYVEMLNGRYGVSKYKAVHDFPINQDEDMYRWKEYMKKIIHPLSVWTAGI